MSFTTVSISAAPYIPLSASYRFDDKIDLKPTYYQYDEGFSFFHHPYNIGAKDVNFANDSFFQITSSQNLVNMINDVSYIDPSELVLFTGFQMTNGNYVTNNNNTLYATATALGQNEFFRVVRNNDGTYSISQNDLYATVLITHNDMRIEMKGKLATDPAYLQKFMIYSGNSENTITIRTMYLVPEWSPEYTLPIQRFWSFFDGNGSNMVKAIGLIENQTHFRYINDYKILATVNLEIFALGFDGKVVWVKYYNDLLNKFFNKSVDIKDFIKDVENNYLIEYPYKTKIDLTNYSDQLKTGNMKINLINLKSIMTPEYDYNVKKE